MLVQEKLSPRKKLLYLRLGIYVISLISVGSIIYFLFLAFFPSIFFQKSSFLKDLNSQKSSSKPAVSSSKPMFSNSFLSTNSSLLTLNLLKKELQDQFKLAEFDPKPFSNQKKEGYIIHFENGDKKLKFNGESFFLDLDVAGKLHFSEEATCLSCTLSEGADCEVVVSLELNIPDVSEDCNYKENQSFQIFPKSSDFQEMIDSKDIVLAKSVLKKAKLIEPDLLIQMYGGKSFDLYKKRFRLTIENNISPTYLEQGDVFFIESGNIVKIKKFLKDKVIYKVEGVEEKSLKLKIWTKDGLQTSMVTIPISRPLLPVTNLLEDMKKIQKRSDNSVTCLLDGRNVILRQGDWVLIQKGKFKNLRNTDEINQYLGCFLKGELFIFDGIKKIENKEVLLGHLFNEDRSSFKKIEIILSEKKNNKNITKNSKKSQSKGS
jgi:hypothetical protein